MLQALLEQFQILQLVYITFFFLDFSIIYFFLINLITLDSFSSFTYYNASQKHYLQEFFLFFSLNVWQKWTEFISEITAQLIPEVINTNNEKYFPFVFILSNFILFSDLFGLNSRFNNWYLHIKNNKWVLQ